jgi:hypothetical protein
MEIFLYRGKDQKKSEGMSATAYPVHVLTSNPRIHKQNHILHVDNWYMSIPLVYMMHEIGINIIGTVKKNVKGLPKDRMLTKKQKREEL